MFKVNVLCVCVCFGFAEGFSRVYLLTRRGYMNSVQIL